MKAPFVAYVTLNENNPLDEGTFPGNLAFTRGLHFDFDSAVTFFVGENGSGKSTLLEAMAVLARLPISGGGLNEVGANHAFTERSVLIGPEIVFYASVAQFSFGTAIIELGAFIASRLWRADK